MRCLIAAILILGTIIGAAILAWMWHGWWGLAVWFGAMFVLAWLLAKFGPGISQSYVSGMYEEIAKGMREATVTLNAIEPATDSNAVADVLRELDGWIAESREEGDDVNFDVDEWLGHSEVRLDLRRYRVDVSIAPPADKPDEKWAPHAFSLIPAAESEPSAFSCEIHEWEDYDEAASRFVPSRLKQAFEEVEGPRRMRMLVSLNPTYSVYLFEYLHSVRYEAQVRLPAVDAADPMRVLTAAIVDRIEQHERIATVSLGFLPVTDADIARLAGVKSLEYLGLDHTQVSDACLPTIAGINGLQQLSLNSTAVTDAGLDALAGMTELKRLFVRKTKVTADGVKALCEKRPGLKVFR